MTSEVALTPKVASSLTPEGAAIGRDRLSTFHRLKVPRKGPVDAATVKQLCRLLNLEVRRTRALIALYREYGTAEALAPRRKGPPVGTIRSSVAMLDAIKRVISEIYMTRVPPANKETAAEIRSRLLEPENAHRFSLAEESLPSTRTLVRILERILPEQRARTQLGPSRRTASEPHPGEYRSEGLLDLVQMDHTKGNVFLVDHDTREEIGRPWITFIIDVCPLSGTPKSLLSGDHGPSVQMSVLWPNSPVAKVRAVRWTSR